jgi:hypothetical protein
MQEFYKNMNNKNVTLYQSVEYKNYNLRKVAIPSRKYACVRPLPKKWFGHRPSAYSLSIRELGICQIGTVLERETSKMKFYALFIHHMQAVKWPRHRLSREFTAVYTERTIFYFYI